MHDDQFGPWLAGFTDGEGCFSVARQRHAKHAYYCSFALVQRDDDTDVVRMIHERMGIGNLVFRKSSASIPNAKPQVGWQVSDRAGTQVLRDFFRLYPLQSKKARAFAIWDQGVTLWNTRSRGSAWALDEAFALEMEEYRIQLRDIKKYEARPLSLAGPDRPSANLRLFDGELEERIRAMGGAVDTQETGT